MRIAAYQFEVDKCIETNLNRILCAIKEASNNSADLLILPECALTGYPPITIPDSNIDFDCVKMALKSIQDAIELNNINCLVGTIDSDGSKRFNRMYLLSPYKEALYYDKTILGGWDINHFDKGTNDGIFEINGFKIGIRICFEVRFPEFFRKFYKEETDLIIVPFFDTSDFDNKEYYDIILGHLRTRAAENLCPIITVNATKPYQGAPTVYLNSDGFIINEAERGLDSITYYEFNGRSISASGKRRKEWINTVLE